MIFDSAKATSIQQKSAKYTKYSEPTKTFLAQILLLELKKNAENFFCSKYTIVLANNRKKSKFWLLCKNISRDVTGKGRKKVRIILLRSAKTKIAIKVAEANNFFSR